MALKDRILRDNHKVFMNTDHFAEEHTWNGVPFTTVPDDISVIIFMLSEREIWIKTKSVTMKPGIWCR